MTVGKLTVILGLDKTGFDTGINSVTGKTTALKKLTDSTFNAMKTAVKVSMAAITGALIASTKAFTGFEQGLANVSTMLSSDTMIMMSKFEDGLLSMSTKFGESTKTLTDGLYDILSASVPASEAMDVLETSTIAAIAGMSDTGTAADAITTLMNSFADSTKDAGYYSDIMFTAVKLGKTTFNEIAGSIGNVATLFSRVGGSAEELSGMLAILTRSGVDTATATTNVKGVVSALLKPSEALTEALGGMTVEADGFTAVMEHISKFPPQDLAEMFPNVRALTGVVIAAEGLEEEVRKINDLMADGSPAQEAYAKNTDTLEFAFSRLKTTFTSTAIEVGRELAPKLKEMIGDLKDWVTTNKDNIVSFFSGFADTLYTLVTTAVQFKDVIIGAGTALATFTILTKITEAMKAFGIATTIGFGPIAAAAAGVGLLVAGLMKIHEISKQYESDTDKMNAALDGTAESVEDYNDGLLVAQERTQSLIDSQKRQSSSMGVVRGDITAAMAVQQAQHERQIENARAEEERIIANRDAYIQAKDAEAIAAQEAAAEEMQAAMNAAAARQEEIAAAQAAEAAERQRQSQINVVIEALEEANKTDQERFEEEVDRLSDLGFTQDEIMTYMKANYEEYSDSIEDQSENATTVLAKNDYELAVKFKENVGEKEEAFKGLEETIITEDENAVTILAKNDEELTMKKKALADEQAETFKGLQKKLIEEDQNTYNEFLDHELGYIGNMNVQFEDKRSMFQRYVDSLKDSWKDYITTLKDSWTDVMSSVLSVANTAGNSITSIWNNVANERVMEIQKSIDEGVLAEKEGQDQIDEIKKEAWDKEKKARLAMAWIDMAGAIIKALVNPGGWAGVGLSIAAGLTGGLQIAAINSEANPYIRGGLVGDVEGMFSGKPGIDTNHALLTDGEYVMPPQQTRDNFDQLEAMRAGAGNGKMTITPSPVYFYLDKEKIGEGTIEYITQQSDRGTFRINPKVLAEA